MKCYVCKREIDRAVRVFMGARDRRERAQFRDLCDTCYDHHMRIDKGLILKNGMWVKP